MVKFINGLPEHEIILVELIQNHSNVEIKIKCKNCDYKSSIYGSVGNCSIDKECIETLKKKYEQELEEYEKEYKYTDNIEYWEGAIHKTEQIINDLEELLK